jgi:hypothetical protein
MVLEQEWRSPRGLRRFLWPAWAYILAGRLMDLDADRRRAAAADAGLE